MKGTILQFSIKENIGIISGSDDKRYKFNVWNWKEGQHPSRGMKVDFDIDEEGQAIDVFPDYDTSTKTIGWGEATLWGLFCFPVGFMRFGQNGKGWTWLIIAACTGGVGSLVALVDYCMSFSAQQRRQLSDWEFFPK